MGVRIDGEWHEELADPGKGEYDSQGDYNKDAGQASKQGGENLNWGSGPGSSPGTSPGTSPNSTYQGLDISGIQRGFQESSGFSIKQLEEQKRQFDATMAWQVKMWEQQGLPELAIKQRVQDLEERKFAELSGQATRQQNWVEEIGRRQAGLAEKAQAEANAIAQGQLGVSQGELELAKEIQRRQATVSEQNLGLDVLKTQASLSGPSNWIQAANFSRGVSGGALPAFVQQLLSGQSTAVMGGAQPGMQQSSPLSFGSMTQGYGLGGQPAAQAGDMMYTQDMVTMPDGRVMPRQQAIAAGYQQPSRGAPQEGLLSQLNDQYAAQKDMFAGQNLNEEQRKVAMANANPGAPAPAAAPGSDVDAAAAKLREVYSKGGQSFGPQQLEGLSPTELEMFKGGGGAVGADVPGFLAQYERSRIGQQSALPG